MRLLRTYATRNKTATSKSKKVFVGVDEFTLDAVPPETGMQDVLELLLNRYEGEDETIAQIEEAFTRAYVFDEKAVQKPPLAKARERAAKRRARKPPSTDAATKADDEAE